jgi:hypothetical protein
MRASRSEGPLRGVGHVLHGLPGPPLTSEGRVGTKLTPPKEVDGVYQRLQGGVGRDRPVHP